MRQNTKLTHTTSSTVTINNEMFFQMLQLITNVFLQTLKADNCQSSTHDKIAQLVLARIIERG